MKNHRSSIAAEYKRIGIKLANELDQVEKERDIYLRALRQIAHFCFQAEGYAAEMQGCAKKAIADGQQVRATGSCD